MPFVILVMVVTSLIRYLYHLPGVTHWTEVYFLQIIAASLPLLQIVFPIAWVTLNCYGLARYFKHILKLFIFLSYEYIFMSMFFTGLNFYRKRGKSTLVQNRVPYQRIRAIPWYKLSASPTLSHKHWRLWEELSGIFSLEGKIWSLELPILYMF